MKVTSRLSLVPNNVAGYLHDPHPSSACLTPLQVYSSVGGPGHLGVPLQWQQDLDSSGSLKGESLWPCSSPANGSWEAAAGKGPGRWPWERGPEGDRPWSWRSHEWKEEARGLDLGGAVAMRSQKESTRHGWLHTTLNVEHKQIKCPSAALAIHGFPD